MASWISILIFIMTLLSLVAIRLGWVTVPEEHANLTLAWIATVALVSSWPIVGALDSFLGAIYRKSLRGDETYELLREQAGGEEPQDCGCAMVWLLAIVVALGLALYATFT